MGVGPIEPSTAFLKSVGQRFANELRLLTHPDDVSVCLRVDEDAVNMQAGIEPRISRNGVLFRDIVEWRAKETPRQVCLLYGEMLMNMADDLKDVAAECDKHARLAFDKAKELKEPE